MPGSRSAAADILPVRGPGKVAMIWQQSRNRSVAVATMPVLAIRMQVIWVSAGQTALTILPGIKSMPPWIREGNVPSVRRCAIHRWAKNSPS